jgi:arylsulfatase
VTPPDVRRGLEQLPVTGHSFASVLANPSAPATNTVQYFENAGSLAVVAGEWKAVLKHTSGQPYGDEKWELYHLAKDRSECNDLAESNPQKLDEMVALWWEQAETHGVLPLDDRGVQLFGARFRKNSPHPEDRRYVYRPPMSPLPGQATAGLGGRNVDLYATVTFTPGDEGVLYATGTQNSGLSLFVQNNKLVLDYNAFGDHTIVESANAVPAGDHELRLLLRRGDGMAGQLTLQVDGSEVATASVPLYMRMMSSVGPSIGHDHGSPVSTRYSAPYAYTGVLHEVVIESGKPRADVKAAEAQSEMNRQ